MMSRKILLPLAMIAMLINCRLFAQQALWGGETITSPEIHNNNTVTFRLKAPAAKEVSLSGDWMPRQGWAPGTQPMKKDESGLWTYTTKELSPDLYSYSFMVDGLQITDPNNVHRVRDIASVSNIFIVGGDQADLYKVNEVPHGTVAHRWYPSPGNDMNRRLTVYTPPGYESSKKTYPVLYLLHGIGGDEHAWMELGRASQIMDNLIHQGKAEPMIVVMTNGNVSEDAAPGETSKGFLKPTMQLPHTMDGKMEETFQDVIKFIEGNYRVQANKQGRAIAGLSMGGYHSLHISRYYPNTFEYVGLFSPAIMPNDQVKSKVYENFDATLKKQMENGYKLYWIGIGKEDFLYKSVDEYKKKLDQMGMPYEYKETGGGHTWTNWRLYLSEFVPKLFKEKS